MSLPESRNYCLVPAHATFDATMEENQRINHAVSKPEHPGEQKGGFALISNSPYEFIL